MNLRSEVALDDVFFATIKVSVKITQLYDTSVVEALAILQKLNISTSTKNI